MRDAGAWRPPLGVACLVAAVLIAGAASLGRPGYSPDEEYTLFAVRGIRAHGLPLLPSGLLYDRGPLYSYASWLAGSVTGLELPAYRALGLASAALSAWLVFVLARRAAGDAAGLAAAASVALSQPFWAVATSGRFYGPFLASYLLCLLLMAQSTEERALGRLRVAALVAAAIACRWTHELAFTLLAVPVVPLLGRLASRAIEPGRPERRPGEGRHALGLALALALGLSLAQAALFGIHFLAPSSGETMIRRFFLWQVMNLITWPLDPFDMLGYVWRATPVTLAAALALAVARWRGLGGEWRPFDRAAHLLWAGWVLWFGVIESGRTLNYLLLPVTFMLAAIALDLVAVVQHVTLAWPGPRAKAARLAAAALALFVAADQWRGHGTVIDRLAAVRPTIDVAGIDAIRDALDPGDRVACTDELACLILLGRVDRWLALHPFVRERFIVVRGGVETGVYAGAPAVSRLADLFARDGGEAPRRVIVVDLFKEHPVGHSAAWLSRALEEERMAWRPLLDTPQARVIQLDAAR